MPFYPKINGSGGGSPGGSRTWTKYEFEAADFSAAAMQATALVVTPAAGQVLVGAIILLDELFAGGAVSAAQVALTTQTDVGSGDYASLMGYDDVFGTYNMTGDTFSLITVHPFITSDDLLITLETTDDNLDQLTQGAVTVWLAFDTLGA